MKKLNVLLYVVIVIFLSGCSCIKPPPSFTCIESMPGQFEDLKKILEEGKSAVTVYGFGLTYKEHIKEVTTRYDSNNLIPVFLKETNPIIEKNTSLTIPNNGSIFTAVSKIDKQLGNDIFTNIGDKMTAALDYEVELGIILLENINWEDINNKYYTPKVGYIIANDLSSRSVQALGDGLTEENKYRFWTTAKSFPGFLVLSPTVWIPDKNVPDEMFCVEITTQLNGNEVQKEMTSNLLYTTRELLSATLLSKTKRTYPEKLPSKGDILLTGTPGGVAYGTIPTWKLWIGERLNLSRVTKLKKIIEQENTLENSNRRFLRSGDRVTISANGFGNISTDISE